METVLRAPFAARLRSCSCPSAARSRPAPRCCAWSRSATSRPRSSTGGRGPSTWTCPMPARRRRDGAASGRPRHAVTCTRPAAGLRRRPRRQRRRLLAPTWPLATSWPPTAGRRWRGDRSCWSVVRRLRRPQPQPAGGRGPARRAPGAQPAGALPHLPAQPRCRAGRAAGRLPRQARPGAAALRRDRSGPHPRARGGRVPDLPGPAALGPRRQLSSPRSCSAGSASRRRPQSAREPAGRPRPAGRRDPAAVPGGRRPRPQRPVPLVRPAAGRRRSGPSVLDGVGDQLATLAGMPRRARPTPTPSTSSPPSPSRSSASSPTGSTAATARRTSRCSRC